MRKGLLDEPMLQACGTISGSRVLDCGCGEGRFCRLLLRHGASYVLGVDLCPTMIEAAEQLRSGLDEYRVADVQNLEFLPDQTFDLAVSYLNQCDVRNFDANNRELFRILRPGKRLVVANVHPMRSAAGPWITDEIGRKIHFILDRYLDEGPRHWKMLGLELTNFHRSLSTCINGFRNAGFIIDRIIEPTVTPDNLRQYPELDDELRVPNFIIYVLQKP